MSEKSPDTKKSPTADDKGSMDAETLLSTLDQLSQTMEIMSKVIGRLRSCLHHQLDSQTQDLLEECEDSFNKITPPSSKGHTLH